MKTISLTLIAIFFLPEISPSQIVINEIMYTPSESSNEWFEVFNAGSSTVNLNNWKWKDATSTLRTITTQNIFLDSGKYLVVCQDSIKLKQQFPGLPGRVIQSSWSQLNNSGDNLILIDNSNFRVDSVSFSSSWGGINASSLERIDPLGPGNSSLNWSTSISFNKATPCTQNSVTPKIYDLSLKSFLITPLYPLRDKPVIFNLKIQNKGLNAAANFTIQIFEDFNFDSIAQSNELVVSRNYSVLAVKDSVEYEHTVQFADTGSKQYIAKLFYPHDNDTTNNKLIRRFYVGSDSGEGNGIVINEIMFDPVSGQSEWIEFYNSSGSAINIKGWMYKEQTTSVTISDSDFVLKPGDYYVLAHDSSIFQTFNYLRDLQHVQFVNFSAEFSLSNSGEFISLTDSNDVIVDKLHYEPGWHNSEVEDPKGKSLERLNALIESNNKSNWSTSANVLGGTPCLKNSINLSNLNIGSSAYAYPNPFSPDNDGFEDFTMIKYNLSIPFGQMRVKVFDMKGRLVRSLANNQVTGSEGAVIFDGMNDNRERLRTGIYILIIEAVDSKAGIVQTARIPVVVASKL